MKKDNINQLFDNLEGTFDTKEPRVDHQQRFLNKLQAAQGVTTIPKKKNTWWKPLSIAASVTIVLGIGFSMFNTSPTIDQQVAKISPEVSQTQFYFASLIEEQVHELEGESTPETKKMIDDTMNQLKKLDANYKILEQDLLNGGNSKLILSAMITNFQTRIDLLQDVLDQVSTIKNLKKYNDENYTI
jgi:hypothetical protein